MKQHKNINKTLEKKYKREENENNEGVKFAQMI
jgi:hypothetical protein